MTEPTAEIREEMVTACRRLYEREMVSSTGGNISTIHAGELLITPTGSALGRLAPRDLVVIERGGAPRGGVPSKELPLHTAVYEARPDVGAVVHGHCAFAIAVAGLLEPDEVDAFPAYTAGYVARVGRLPLLAYLPSGSVELGVGVARALGADGRAVLLRNHGFVTVASTLASALDVAEELLDALKVFIYSNGRAPALDDAQRSDVLAARRAASTQAATAVAAGATR
jgi:ribulose-5-phosphate 4-epimerase/fuculose-1-phosphate aldolase